MVVSKKILKGISQIWEKVQTQTSKKLKSKKCERNYCVKLQSNLLKPVINFKRSKDTNKKTKGQVIKWEKIFAMHISCKRLIVTIYKELLWW